MPAFSRSYARRADGLLAITSCPTWRRRMSVRTGTLVVRRRRTVAAALHTSIHPGAQSSTIVSSGRHCQRLLLIVESVVPTGASVDLVIDDTLGGTIRTSTCSSHAICCAASRREHHGRSDALEQGASCSPGQCDAAPVVRVGPAPDASALWSPQTGRALWARGAS
jgi:hypothetical protein